MATETKQYRLRAGFTHYSINQDGGELSRLHAGDVVELTQAQAEAFADRFEALDGSPASGPMPTRISPSTGPASMPVSLAPDQQVSAAEADGPEVKAPAADAKNQQPRDAK